MRILIISHAYVTKYHQEKIEALAERKDLEIFLMTPEFGIEGGGRKIYLEKTKDENYKIIPIKTYFSGKWNSYLIKRFRYYLRRIKPDIIHLEEEYWTNAAWQIQKELKKFPNIKLILFTWENIYHNWKKEGKNLYPAPKLETQNYQSSSKLVIRKKKFLCWIYQRLRFNVFNFIEKKVLRKADLIIAGNKEAVDVLRKKGYSGRIEVIAQFGVNQEYFKKKDVDELKSKLELNNFFVVGYIGRIAKEKGIGDLIKAAKSPLIPLCERGKEYKEDILNSIPPLKKGVGGFSKETAARVKFLIIGNGPYKLEAQELVKKIGLEQSFVFVSSVDFNQIVDYYNLMDLMVIPSRTTSEWKEQFGRTIIEAMSCGVPVVGSDSGAIPEVVGDAGLIFKEGDIDNLFEKIGQVANNKNLKRDLAERGLKRVKENFTTEVIAKRTYEIYRAVESSL